jgi:hypothetical protein
MGYSDLRQRGLVDEMTIAPIVVRLGGDISRLVVVPRGIVWKDIPREAFEFGTMPVHDEAMN